MMLTKLILVKTATFVPLVHQVQLVVKNAQEIHIVMQELLLHAQLDTTHPLLA